MKKIFIFLLVVLILFPTSITFAGNHHEVTFEELNELATKYDFEPQIVNITLSQDKVISNLTKNELESLIIKSRKRNSKPLHFEEKVYIQMPESSHSNRFINATSNGWVTKTGVDTLSRTGYHLDIEEFKLKKSVSVSYEYEAQYLPGEPDPTRNWKFTDCDEGSVDHLNEGAYIIKSVTSEAEISSSSTSITQTYSGVVDTGIYIGIDGAQIRIPTGENDFSGNVAYIISEVQ
ncbi:hypothetical protein [Maledivibacter halophilus]|uniref:Uncharacterized protein n=1 Tax=Maledivibacter halophilus TaxID=36842 RepID=A0A1T5MRP9_9FIRM|nr:hypothetical protein [Maledivibacter halophilus]SKC90910.1 hypothetical protein SAMN02194393_05237 [Maledivibacter halophilus]